MSQTNIGDYVIFNDPGYVHLNENLTVGMVYQIKGINDRTSLLHLNNGAAAFSHRFIHLGAAPDITDLEKALYGII